MYVVYVLIVLVADVYHRAVMVPRIRHEMEMREQLRQIEAGRVASLDAGNAWGDLAGGGGIDDDDGDDALASVASEGGGRERKGCGPAPSDDRTHVSAPPQMKDIPMACSTPIIKNRALNAVLTALSNYNDVEHDFDDADNDGGGSDAAAEGRRRGRHDGWGVESTIEGSRPWDRPVVLHGADGVLTRHPHHHPQLDGTETEDGIDRFNSPYRVMEDMDMVERLCVHEGSMGYPPRGWVAAWHDARQELLVHFRECWSDIMDDDDSSRLNKVLLVCEYPLTVARKVRLKILHVTLLFICGLDSLHHQTFFALFSYPALVADCVDPVRRLLLSCTSCIVIFAIALMVGHVLTEQFRNKSLGLADGSFHGNHMLRRVDDNEVCSRRRWNNDINHRGES